MMKRSRTTAAASAAAEARSARELAAALNRAAVDEAAAPAATVIAPPAFAVPLRERIRSRTGTAELLLFRVGGEHFAADLAVVEEAVELTELRVLPEMPTPMVGLVRVRGRMTTVYSPARALGVSDREAGVALLVRGRERRIGLAVDDVDDVLRVDLAAVVEPPARDDDVVLGMTRRERDIVAILDVPALVTACLSALEIG